MIKIPVVTERTNASPAEQNPKQLLAAQIDRFNKRLNALPETAAEEKAKLLLEMANTLIDLKQPQQAYQAAKQATILYISLEKWDEAAHALDAAYRSDEPDAVNALGQAIWLAVTFPINMDLSIGLLNHLIDDTPDDYDAAALAAATACYLVELRAEKDEKENLAFFTQNLLGQVARRHSGVEAQDAFNSWVKRLQLDQPNEFLPRLRNVIDVLVQQDWWFNTEEIKAKLSEA